MTIVFLSNEKKFSADGSLTLLQAAQDAKLVLEHSCRTGRCGSCKARVLEGEVNPCGEDTSLSSEERAQGWILTCVSSARGDVVRLDVEDVGILADFPVKITPTRIDFIERLAPDVMGVKLRLPPSNGLRYLAGQYVDVLGKGGVRRSYSISNHADVAGKIDLEIRKVEGGVLSQYWFAEAKVGDLLRIEGPKGTFFLRDVTGLDLVFLATGTGIAPVKAMLAELSTRPAGDKPKSVTVYWGGRNAADLYWTPFSTVEFRFVPVLSRGDENWQGARGYVQDVLLVQRPDLKNTVVYACGSPEMIGSASATLRVRGLPERRFFSDAFVSSAI
ncbi:FAD-binding oxidoreductase [Variovorax ginsengisoli]|uniref:CDP-4-dehydro-6-deoxyglucose reductase n=1 Tax=Variovorax ginsengisoli TaxID=363844 RepID=A0ABT9SCV2_9BURK|nr:FAD-binding oxidoreductase [Variovorax ginsengisoli]MDP9902183.1 CDP-4-dehydro-6-deoxyglucose reductase [Variovorax ginsengisoli]